MKVTINLVHQFIRVAEEVALDPYTIGYCIRRLKSEGVRFLTVTLPKLSRAVLAGLEKGWFDRADLTCFAWKSGSLRYFRSFLCGIFGSNGRPLPKVSADALKRLRTLCDYWYKLEYPVAEERVAEAEAKFLENEAELRAMKVDNKFVDQLRRDFETFYPELSRASIHEIFTHCRPRDSSGSFAGSNTGIPYYFRRSSRGLSGRYPKGSADVAGYFKPYPAAPVRLRPMVDTKDGSEFLLVPKDSRGPRTIVREPLLALRAQLAFFDFVSAGLTKASHGRINFHDQGVNRGLAQSSSVDREWCTLDLKDASDRVHYGVVKRLFQYSPGLRTMLKRYRTPFVYFKGNKQRLYKLAGMGSGFTFPTMALLVHLSIVRTLVSRCGLTYAQAKKIVYVYGDDIVVPSCYQSEAIQALGRVGLRVNTDKSFRLSHFRESCGGDYYKGIDVTPTRLKMTDCGAEAYRSTLVFKKRDASLFKLERHCRELVQRGMNSLAEFYYQVIESHIGPLPKGSRHSPYMVRVSDSANPVLDSTGTGVPVKGAYLAVSSSEEHKAHCPYHYLGGHLRRNSDKPRVGSFGRVTVPRAIRLRKVDVLSTDLFYQEETQFQAQLSFQGLKHGLIFPTAPF